MVLWKKVASQQTGSQVWYYQFTKWYRIQWNVDLTEELNCWNMLWKCMRVCMCVCVCVRVCVRKPFQILMKQKMMGWQWQQLAHMHACMHACTHACMHARACVRVCIWASCCHCYPITFCFIKIQNGLPFWCWLTQVVLEKRPLNRCSCVVVVYSYSALTAVVCIVKSITPVILSDDEWAWLSVSREVQNICLWSS